MAGVNKVILLGNLGKDPEVRYSQNQTAIARFSLATSERRKDSTGNWTDHTEWHNIVAFGKTAELAGKYLKKGRQVFIDGQIRTNKWQDKETGKDRYTTEIIVNNLTFVGQKGEGSGYGSNDDAPSYDNRVLDSLPSADSLQQAGNGSPMGSVSFDDDDIPF